MARKRHDIIAAALGAGGPGKAFDMQPPFVPEAAAFAERARAMRQRLASSIDSTDTIRADRERV